MSSVATRRVLLAAAAVAAALAAGVPAAIAAQVSTPPSVTGGAVLAYADSDGVLQIVTPDGVVHHTSMGLAVGTSPSIAAGPSQNYLAVIQATTGVLWAVNASMAGQPQLASVAPGTSPSGVPTPPPSGIPTPPPA